VRLDSGNLAELVPAVRQILDSAGLADAKIMVTGDMNEYRIHELLAARIPIDMFGAGTDLAASADAPTLGVIYKMVEIEDATGVRYPVKLSQEKHTLPGAKQIFRFADHDVVGRSSECQTEATALVRPVMLHGELFEPLPSVHQAREFAAESLAKLPAPCLALYEGHYQWQVDLSDDLRRLASKAESEAASQ
jgi:nicotinate phosphoribosyltransferase